MLTQYRHKLVLFGVALTPSFFESCSPTEPTGSTSESVNQPARTQIERNDEPDMSSSFAPISEDMQRWRNNIADGSNSLLSDIQSNTIEWSTSTVDWTKTSCIEGSRKVEDWALAMKDWGHDIGTDSNAIFSEWAASTKQTVGETTIASTEIAKEWSACALVWGKEISEKTTNELLPASQQLAQRGLESAKEKGAAIVPQAQKIAEQSTKAIRDTIISASGVLTKWGVSIETQREMMRIGIDIVPLLGAIKKYDEARDDYKKGIELGDQEKIHKSKVLCLVAFSELGFDIGLFGMTEWTEGLQVTLSNLSVIKSAGSISELDVQALGPVMEQALEVKSVDSAVVRLLEWTAPGSILKVVFPTIESK